MKVATPHRQSKSHANGKWRVEVSAGDGWYIQGAFLPDDYMPGECENFEEAVEVRNWLLSQEGWSAKVRIVHPDGGVYSTEAVPPEATTASWWYQLLVWLGIR